MKLIISFLFALVIYVSALPQSPIGANDLLSGIQGGGPWPEKILSTRSAAIYTPNISIKDLEKIQQSFQQLGIDAIAYFANDIITSGRDVTKAYVSYLGKREVAYLIFLSKDNTYKFTAVPFSGKENIVDSTAIAWSANDQSLDELLKKLFRTAGNYKKQNLLVNDIPETGIFVNPIGGKRSESFALDLKVDPLAVPKFGHTEADKQLEEIMKNYPYKYGLVDPALTDKELRKQGYLYMLNFVQTRNGEAKKLLGYKEKEIGDTISSVSYPAWAPTSEQRNIASNVKVIKFYFKHIESGNVFLGTKWDADIEWSDALRNLIQGFKTELRIN